MEPESSAGKRPGLPCYALADLLPTLGTAALALSVCVGVAVSARADGVTWVGWAVRMVLAFVGAIAAALHVLRFHADNGGAIYVRRGVYVRRWALPNRQAASHLQPVLRSICHATVGDILPHPALSDVNELARDKVVFLVFDASTRADPEAAVDTVHSPCMFHLAFRASYLRRLVIHMGLGESASHARTIARGGWNATNAC